MSWCIETLRKDGYRCRITFAFACCATLSIRHGSGFRHDNLNLMEVVFVTFNVGDRVLPTLSSNSNSLAPHPIMSHCNSPLSDPSDPRVRLLVAVTSPPITSNVHQRCSARHERLNVWTSVPLQKGLSFLNVHSGGHDQGFVRFDRCERKDTFKLWTWVEQRIQICAYIC